MELPPRGPPAADPLIDETVPRGVDSISRRSSLTSPMSRSRRFWSFSTHLRKSRTSIGGVSGGSAPQFDVAGEDAGDDVGDRFALKCRATRQQSHTERIQTPRCRFACRPRARAPAPGSYTPPYRESRRLASSPAWSTWAIGSHRTTTRSATASPSRARSPAP